MINIWIKIAEGGLPTHATHLFREERRQIVDYVFQCMSIGRTWSRLVFV